MRIADNAELLEIKTEQGGVVQYIYPVLTWDENELVLIDTALPGQTELLKETIEQAGFAFEKITKVIITHQDTDHIGSAAVLAGSGVKILAHEYEIPYIQGDKTPVRITETEKRLNELSDEERAFFEKMKAGVSNFYVRVDRPLKDGERLDICGGIKVIHTPGHMPGHIALLLEKSKILVAGDAANAADGKLSGANPQYTQDMAEADASFEKMMAFKPSLVVCYHGGLCKTGENR
ncbi:MAG: MBL fold metallo-hydrolase [Oscillospiraceae bacterium]|nr:MBL fold metallo-hydrolase [Oscillospiraceae bacterium]